MCGSSGSSPGIRTPKVKPPPTAAELNTKAISDNFSYQNNMQADNLGGLYKYADPENVYKFLTTGQTPKGREKEDEAADAPSAFNIPEVEMTSDQRRAAADAAREKARRALLGRKGRKSTILTSGQGVEDKKFKRKTLLGE